MDLIERAKAIDMHYAKVWNNSPQIFLWDKGPFHDLPPEFRILEFKPSKKRDMWTYATRGMSSTNSKKRIELHIFSKSRDHSIIELLTVIAHYHHTSENLELNDTVNFGRAWQDDSQCTFGFISLPYLDGPGLEVLQNTGLEINFYWLVPITASEKAFRKKNGTDALEDLFEDKGLNYIDANRASLVP